MEKAINKTLLKTLCQFQKNEITESVIYSRLASSLKDQHNAAILQKISLEENGHYQFLKRYTNQSFKPNWLKVTFFYWISKIMGITFGIKLLENGESHAQLKYAEVVAEIPDFRNIMEDEDAHEKELINMIEEERLNYVGSIVLGLNDALVELTGALAGFTFALNNTQVIALAGLITGIAASFSMAASGYLSKKAENDPTALKSATYTGIAYVITVGLLILPYLIIQNIFICLALTLTIAILIILFFNYYISVAQDLPFKRRFIEMAVISLGVSAITFGIGFLLRKFTGIDL
jgi:vacuolar iron transporter family protein